MRKLNYLILAILLAPIGCQKYSTNPLPYSPQNLEWSINVNSRLSIPSSSVFTFEDSNGVAIADAEVLFGQSIDNPFVGNFLKTDTKGQIEINQDFSDMPITISTEGFIRTTFFDINPGSQKFRVRRLNNSAPVRLFGSTSGYGTLKHDNMADFGVIIQGLSRENLMAFDMNMLISTESDQIVIQDQKVNIPSNITLPRQTEDYFIPITFEKKTYRFFTPTKGVNQIYALHGQFPFTEVVDELRHKAPFGSLLNYFKFIGASLLDVNIDGTTSQDINVNGFSFNKKVGLNTLTIPAEKTMILISATEINGKFYPTDLKKVEGAAKSIYLNSAPIGTPHFIAVLKRSADFYTNSPKEFALSASLFSSNESKISEQPHFMDLVNTPSVDLDAWKISEIPKLQNGIYQQATYALLSQTNKTTQQKYLIWEAYDHRWVNQMNLPLWPTNQNNTTLANDNNIINSWEISYLGTTEVKKTNELNYTHVSYNKKDFQ